MSNVEQLHPQKPEAFSPESELYFDVWERPAYFAGGHSNYYEDPHHKHIVRMWKDEPCSIGLVGKNYKLLKNRELGEGIEDTFMEALTPKELKDVSRRDRISYMGGTSIRDYIFPAIRADIGSKQSDVAFRAIVINGYDGSSSFKFYHGAIDFFCLNGMVTGSYDMIVRRHTSGLSVPRLTDRLRQSVNIFYKQSEQWAHWVGKEICDEDAEQCYQALPNVSERRVQQLMRQFRIEVESHGDIVRLIKDDDSGEPMRVLEVSDFPSGITLCATGKNYKGDGHDHAYTTFDTTDLELYPPTRNLLASQMI